MKAAPACLTIALLPPGQAPMGGFATLDLFYL